MAQEGARLRGLASREACQVLDRGWIVPYRPANSRDIRRHGIAPAPSAYGRDSRFWTPPWIELTPSGNARLDRMDERARGSCTVLRDIIYNLSRPEVQLLAPLGGKVQARAGVRLRRDADFRPVGGRGSKHAWRIGAFSVASATARVHPGDAAFGIRGGPGRTTHRCHDTDRRYWQSMWHVYEVLHFANPRLWPSYFAPLAMTYNGKCHCRAQRRSNLLLAIL
jgi:hypothetical protein